MTVKVRNWGQTRKS